VALARLTNNLFIILNVTRAFAGEEKLFSAERKNGSSLLFP